MISGIDLNATIDFTLPEDKDNPTIFKLGVLPSYLLGQLSAAVAKTGDIEMAFKILQVAIKGWENFGGVEYKTIKEKWFGRELDIVPLELLDRLPLKNITALSARILEINGLTVEERKNS